MLRAWFVVCLLVAQRAHTQGALAGQKNVEYKNAGAWDGKKMVAALLGDPFLADKGLRDQFDTDLKKKSYFKSADGKAKSQELAALKATLLGQSFSVEIGYPSEYDLKKKGFTVWLPLPPGHAKDLDMTKEYGQSADDVWLPSNMKVIVVHELGKYRRGVFVRVPESEAMKVENEKDTVVRLRFHLTGNVRKWQVTDREYGVAFINHSAEIKDITFVFAKKAGEVLAEVRP